MRVSNYFHVKVHLLGLLGCELRTCANVFVAKRKEMEKECNVGVARVVASSKKTKNDDPLQFLNKTSSKFPFESFGGGVGQAAKRKEVALGPMDKIRKRNEKSLISPLHFFLSKLHIL